MIMRRQITLGRYHFYGMAVLGAGVAVPGTVAWVVNPDQWPTYLLPTIGGAAFGALGLLHAGHYRNAPASSIGPEEQKYQK